MRPLSHHRFRHLLIAALTLTGTALAGQAAGAEPPPSKVDPGHESNAESSPPVPADADLNVIKVVYEVGLARGVSAKVMLAGFEAGWVESHMNNLNCGDLDSIGVFQQRPSMGWCDPASLCLDVAHASHKFFSGAQAAEPTCACTAGQLVVPSGSLPDLLRGALAPLAPALDAAEDRARQRSPQ